MKNFIRPITIVAATFAVTTAMAGVTFYEAENFSGQPITVNGTDADLRTRGSLTSRGRSSDARRL